MSNGSYGGAGQARESVLGLLQWRRWPWLAARAEHTLRTRKVNDKHAIRLIMLVCINHYSLDFTLTQHESHLRCSMLLSCLIPMIPLMGVL